MKNCPNPECTGSEDSLEIVEDERCIRDRCCWVHCDWCGVAGPTAGPSDESAIEAWDRLPRITEENYAALKDEFNRGAALAQQHCPKPQLGHSVFEGIPLLAAEVERLKAVIAQEIDRYSSLARYDGEIKSNNLDLRAKVEQLKAHTWQQERAAVVAWLRLEPSYQNRPWAVIMADIERGGHWPEGGTP